MGTRAKKIQTWKYKDKGVKVDVPVYMQADYRGVEKFYVELPDLEIKESNDDINKLKDTVFELIKTRVVLEWEAFLYVQIEGSSVTNTRHDDLDTFVTVTYSNADFKVDVNIAVSRVLVAKVSNGQTLHKQMSGYHTTTAQPGLPPLGENQGSMLAMIPDTPENRQALVDIGHGFERLTATLQDLLSPDRIAKSLEQVQRTKALPGLPGQPDASA